MSNMAQTRRSPEHSVQQEVEDVFSAIKKTLTEHIRQKLCDRADLRLRMAKISGAHNTTIQLSIDCVWESTQRGGKLVLCGNGEVLPMLNNLAAELMSGCR
jgi:hypothetical protein